MYLTIITLPLLGSIAAGLLGRKALPPSKKVDKKHLHTSGSKNSKASNTPAKGVGGGSTPRGKASARKKSKVSKASKASRSRELHTVVKQPVDSEDSKGHYFSGFVDGEGCFRVKILRNSAYKLG